MLIFIPIETIIGNKCKNLEIYLCTNAVLKLNNGVYI